MSVTKKHGMSHTRIYQCWADMKVRCLCKTNKWYPHYGGRGITVCDEWMKFETFYEWAMSHGYRDDLTIERIDNNGMYCPKNCRWATKYEQCLNRSYPRGKTGHVGIRERLPGWFTAEVYRKNKNIYIGHFQTIEEAVAAREEFLRRNNM